MDAWRETDEEMVTLQSKNVTSYTAREGLLLSLTQPLIIKKAYVVQKKPAAARPKNDNTSFSVQPAFSLVNDTVTRCYSGSLLRLDIYSGGSCSYLCYKWLLWRRKQSNYQILYLLFSSHGYRHAVLSKPQSAAAKKKNNNTRGKMSIASLSEGQARSTPRFK